jgi:hypothetical protein
MFEVPPATSFGLGARFDFLHQPGGSWAGRRRIERWPVRHRLLINRLRLRKNLGPVNLNFPGLGNPGSKAARLLVLSRQSRPQSKSNFGLFSAGETNSARRLLLMTRMSWIFLLLGVAFLLGSCTTEYDWPPESSPSRPASATPDY